jgi:hypothetical protein
VAENDQKKTQKRAHYRNNRDERLGFSSSKPIIYAEEATFEALEAARKSKNKQERERYLIGRLKDAKRAWSQNGHEMFAMLVHLKLLKKQRLMKHCAAKKSLVTKWTCDMCKSCSLERFEHKLTSRGEFNKRMTNIWHSIQILDV